MKMEASEKAVQQIQEFRREFTKQMKELKAQINEIKKVQSEILGILKAEEPVKQAEVKRAEDRQTAPEEKKQPATVQMYCTHCLEMKPIVAVKKVLMPDGSTAIQGNCAECGTRSFRMTSMSGTLVDEAAISRLRSMRS